ncbi:replication-associated recombination protein A [Clostridiaceae bacterium NSJ-31]|uniref:Replication-associated recombination protein A n=1 Tax=Ligaoa zhengdingensis TaxID=2763658 RepID=A0A926DZP3_9FIRM|nr:replication-associated recombination protein A [Ligaoa zhengdingensis]MBC8546502.1 replication-associated recombination protein A [Ligaoa zhengdingensis]
MTAPLADRIRPQTLDEVVGQRHILGPDKVLRRIVESGSIPNLIFYGPSGVGKTTVARIIAQTAGKRLFKLNGTTASTADIREVVAECDTFGGMNGVLLYLDEIQYLNKKQQQSLLEFIENGQITLIASTTENPYFYIYNAILSRSTVFEFKPVSAEEIAPAVRRAFGAMERELGYSVAVSDEVVERIALSCGGDVRKAVNAVELCALAARADGNGNYAVALEDAEQVSQRSANKYDRAGDEHYDLVSALQKSVRGSDENAALHYLARLLEAGDLLSPCRRLLVMASEDVGLAYPMAAVIVKSCVDSALQLGLPEARIPLAEAVVLMCTAPKSNSANLAIDAALADVRAGRGGPPPRCLQNKHYDGAEVEKKGQFYRYPHDYPGHWVEQQYLPDSLRDRVYYTFGDNKTEQMAKSYREGVQRKKEG